MVPPVATIFTSGSLSWDQALAAQRAKVRAELRAIDRVRMAHLLSG
jgi:hypothetical protein